nr:PREDICTED: mediator of RNA polymerase II transcription subunit 15a-like [Daucus carota subsp. sativus]
MEGIRTMNPWPNANYLNQSNDVALSLDEQLYHNIHLEIQMLRESYSSEVEIIHKMVKDPCPKALSGASLTRHQKKLGVARMITRVLSSREADLARYSKDKVRQRLNTIKWHLEAIRSKRLGSMSHHEHHPPADHFKSHSQKNDNMEMISSQMDQGLTNQHASLPQSSIQQGFSVSRENSINSLCNDKLVGYALSSFQNSPKSFKQQSPTNYAEQITMLDSPNIECQFGVEKGSQSLLHHGLRKSLHKQNLYSQQNPLPSNIASSLVPTMSRVLTSSVNYSHAVKQKAKNQIMNLEKMKQPVQKSRIEKKMQQMVVQKEYGLEHHKLCIQSAGYSPQILTSSLPSTDHENQSFCTENTIHLQRPVVPVEQSQTSRRKYAPAGSSQDTGAPLSIEFDTQEISLQPQPVKRLIKVVESMSTEALCASLQEFNAVINLVDNNGTGSGYPILERNIISSDIPSHDKVNRQISAMAFNSLSSFSRGTFSKRGCNQAADMILTPTYRIKKLKMEQNRDIFGEIRAINLQLIETSLDVDFGLPEDAARAGVGDGTIIRCSYNAVGTLAKSLRMQYASSPTLPDFIMLWLVPADYPHSSPMLLDTMPGQWSEVYKDMSEKLVLKLNQSIQTLSHPISLEEMVRNWDASARAVFTEFAEERVGKSLGSNLRTWENYITTL